VKRKRKEVKNNGNYSKVAVCELIIKKQMSMKKESIG